MSDKFENALNAVEQAGPDTTEPRDPIIDEEFEDFDCESEFWNEHGYHDDLRMAFPEPDPAKVPGFCCGCGAHHVRDAGRMLCTDCNAEFRDIG